ncbi:hypothetical protein ACUHMQ_07900 [Chitinimonas sp. PSY-7]|uniref:hypothetical protein n=1 Tax=Chitinimonas sp. PSY-7 TaxID=3459088 RepID=UPI0040403A4F
MLTIPALIIPLMRKVKSLLFKHGRTPSNTVESSHRANGVYLLSNHIVQQGTPVYLPAKYL